MLTARELMTKDPVAIPETARIRHAAQVLQSLDVRHVPVVNEANELVGMLSDRDLRTLTVPYIVDGELVGDISTARDAAVTSLMSGDVISVLPEATAADIVELLLEYKIGAVPVTEPDGTLIGIVSYMDVLRSMPLSDEPD